MSELASKASRGAIWRGIETAGSEGASFLMFVLLARLLLPEHFGLVALASSIVLSLQCLLQFGLPEALIQRKDLTEATIRSAMAASLLLGVGLLALSWLIAWPLAWALDRPEFVPIFLALANVLLLQSLSFPLHGLLRRDLNLKAIAIRTLTATAVGGVLAAVLASQGWGAWALVAQQLTVAAVGLLMLLRVSPIKPWPLQFDRAALAPLIKVARPVMVGQFATQVARRLDAVVLGLFLGNHDIGIYFLVTRVIQAAQMVTQFSIGELTLAVLSRLQHDPLRLRAGVRRALRITGFACLLGFGGLSLAAPILVPLVFGPAMADAAEPLRLLALFATAGAVISTSVHALIALDAAATSSRLAVAASVLQLAAVFAFARFGMVPLVLAIGVAQVIMVVPALSCLSGYAKIDRSRLLSDQAVIVAAFVGAMMIGMSIGPTHALTDGLLSLLMFTAAMAVTGCWIFRKDLPGMAFAKG